VHRVTALLVTILVASLLGSPHCAGMCGVFVAFATGAGDASAPRQLVLAAAYHGGRLLTYVLLGVICGLLGSALELGGAMVGLQQAAAVAAGSMMVVFGSVAALRSAGVKIAPVAVHAPFKKALIAGQRIAMKWKPVPRALTIGLLTTLLPCGWLWAFAVTAAATASPWLGAAVMAVFWLGTVPILAALGAGVRKLAGTSVPGISVITSVAIIVIGLYMIATRATISPQDLAARSAAAASKQSLLEHVQSLEPEHECCKPKP
jgi:sulfite exporter TauE/SafE